MPKLIILPELRDLIPPLSADELAGLEKSLAAEGCRVPLDVWPTAEANVLIDGHNRYEICERLGIPYETRERRMQSKAEAMMWMIDNQLCRRNLPTYERIRLVDIRIKAALSDEAKAKQAHGQTAPGKTLCLDLDKANIDTKKETARVSGASPANVAKVRKIEAKADEETKAQVRAGEISINEAHARTVREEKRAEIIQKLEDVSAKEIKRLEGAYDVIVIDPPWPMQKIERDVRPNQSEFDYPTMSEAELAAMEIPAADDCHMWLWTTHKFLPMSLRLLGAWDFKYVCTFTWHKPGGFQPIGLPQYNCEFAIYARRGSPKFIDTKAFPTCFNAPRGAHSEKPEEFYDVVRRVTAGLRIDIFNRRKIEGFDCWGKESA